MPKNKKEKKTDTQKEEENVLMTMKMKIIMMKIKDRHDSWHDFNPSAFDGSQLLYPTSHIKRLPVGSPAALLHLRVMSCVREAFNDLVMAKAVREYWNTGERDDWFDRALMSEILPSYFEAIEKEAEAEAKKNDNKKEKKEDEEEDEDED